MKGKVVCQTIFFDVALYDKVEWLTACEIRQALFCWYCLLFESQELDWAKRGVTNLVQLDLSISNHANCAEHLQCVLNLAIFLQEVGAEDLMPPATTNHAFNKNHVLARRMIDVICFSILQMNPRTEYQERRKKLVKDCIQNFQLYRDYDILNTSIVNEAIEMLQTNPTIVDDMAGAVKTVIMHSIEKELQQSTYVSMILSEHSRRERESQISVVLRYLRNGNVCERFVRFCNSHLQKKSTILIDAYINEAIDDFKIAKKIIAVSVDADVLAIEHQIVLESKLLKKYPHLIFVPSYFHKLSRSLVGSLSFNNELDVFFKKLTLMKKVFRKSSNAREQFQKCISVINESKRKETLEDLELCMSDSTISARYFEALKTHRTTFVEFLESILRPNHNMVVVGAPEPEVRVLYDFLKSVKTSFLFETLAKFFRIVQPLVESMENKEPSPVLDKTVLMSVYKCLQDEGKMNSIRGECTFEELWRKIVEQFKEGEDTIQCENAAGELMKKSFYNKLYWEIQKCILANICERFKSSQRLAFFDIMNFKAEHCHQLTNPMNQLKSAYKRCSYFNYELLVGEIKHLQGEQAFSTCESAIQVMDILSKFHLKQRFPNVYNLSELLLTMSCYSPNPDGIPHKLNMVKDWCYTCDFAVFDHRDNFSIICIERDYLGQVRQNDIFFGEVMARFEEKNSCFNLR